VKSGIGQLEYKVCETLGVTPKQLGKLREEDPDGVAFIEQHIIWEAEERHKAYKEAERKSKKSKPRRRR
jgi:hypothetical protein